MGACASCAAPSAAAGEDALRRDPASAVPAPLGPPRVKEDVAPNAAPRPAPKRSERLEPPPAPPRGEEGARTPPGDAPEAPRTRSDRRAEGPRTRSGSSGGGEDEDEDEDALGHANASSRSSPLAPLNPALRAPPGLLEAAARRVAASRSPDSDDAEQTKAKIYADLKAFQAHLPRRDPAGAERLAAFAAAASAPPEAPAALAKLFEDALLSGDEGWASASAASALLADDVTYRTMDGKVAVGKAEAIDKLNEAVAKLATRMRRAPGGGGGGGNADAGRGGKKTTSFYAPSVRSDGPRRSGEKEGTWVMTHVFSMLLMKVKVREEFRVDERGKIVELTRTRM
jgi:hypothetical protein